MKAPSYVILLLFFLVLLAPLYIMVIGSFTHLEGFLMKPPSLLLRNPTLRNYRIVLGDKPILLWCANTFIIAGSTVVLSLFCIILAGYCFSRYPGRVMTVIYLAFLLTIMVPKNVLIIPLFIIFKNLGLSGTRAAVVIPSVFYPVGLFIYKTYIDKISTAYDDCARIDGAREWYVISRIIVPMSRPAIAAVATFVLMGSLREFLWQYLVLQKEHRRTLIVGLMDSVYQMSNTMNAINPIGTKMAAGMVIFIPLLLIYIFLHRHFLEGITTGGIKG